MNVYACASPSDCTARVSQARLAGAGSDLVVCAISIAHACPNVRAQALSIVCAIVIASGVFERSKLRVFERLRVAAANDSGGGVFGHRGSHVCVCSREAAVRATVRTTCTRATAAIPNV